MAFPFWHPASACHCCASQGQHVRLEAAASTSTHHWYPTKSPFPYFHQSRVACNISLAPSKKCIRTNRQTQSSKLITRNLSSVKTPLWDPDRSGEVTDFCELIVVEIYLMKRAIRLLRLKDLPVSEVFFSCFLQLSLASLNLRKSPKSPKS